jgi:hypothetical protein
VVAAGKEVFSETQKTVGGTLALPMGILTAHPIPMSSHNFFDGGIIRRGVFWNSFYLFWLFILLMINTE